MSKPIIAVAALYSLTEQHTWMQTTYTESIIEAGGIPMIIPHNLVGEDIGGLLERAEGIVFPGGPDVMPGLYGENTEERCGRQCPERDMIEFAAARYAMEKGKPMLCICRGMQMINVVLGGTLYQDLSDFEGGTEKIIHSQEKHLDSGWGFHKIEIARDSALAGIVGKEEVMVNSLHHQGIKKLSERLKATARTEDGLIEAVEQKEGSLILGVQWHPEKMKRSGANSEGLFGYFVKICRER